MSQRFITVLIALSVLASSNAFASRAKELVMGTADPFGVLSRGSFYHDSNNNIFYNPAYANEYKNWATIEKTKPAAATGLGVAAASTEGGFVTSVANMSVGAYLNRGQSAGTGFNSALSPFSAAVGTSRPIDLVLAGDMGVKWGLGLTSAGFKTSAASAFSYNAITAGIQYMDFEPFMKLTITGKETGLGAADAKSKSFTIGTRYKWGEWAPYFAFRKDTNTTAASVVTTSTVFGLGLGRNTKVSDNVHLNYAIAYWSEKESKRAIVPINMSLEADMASWITGRAGLTYNLSDRTDTNTTPVAAGTTDGTTGRIGATFHLGKADLDWAVGHGATGTEVVDGTGFDLASGFFTAASLTYHW